MNVLMAWVTTSSMAAGRRAGPEAYQGSSGRLWRTDGERSGGGQHAPVGTSQGSAAFTEPFRPRVLGSRSGREHGVQWPRPPPKTPSNVQPRQASRHSTWRNNW